MSAGFIHVLMAQTFGIFSYYAASFDFESAIHVELTQLFDVIGSFGASFSSTDTVFVSMA